MVWRAADSAERGALIRQSLTTRDATHSERLRQVWQLLLLSPVRHGDCFALHVQSPLNRPRACRCWAAALARGTCRRASGGSATGSRWRCAAHGWMDGVDGWGGWMGWMDGVEDGGGIVWRQRL